LRGVKHLQELEEARRAGYRTAVCFVIQMENVSWFEPNDRTHPAFGAALRHAAEAGVEPGDVILAADGQPIRDNWELLDFRRTVHVGDTVDLTILRDGQEIHCYVTLTATM